MSHDVALLLMRNGCASEFGDNLRLNAETVFPDLPYETLICTSEAYVVLQLFLHDYDNDKILSFCRGTPMIVMNMQDIWGDNRKAIANYAPSGKDLVEANLGNRRPRNLQHNQNVPIAPPSALVLFDRKLYVLNMGSNRVSVIDL